MTNQQGNRTIRQDDTRGRQMTWQIGKATEQLDKKTQQMTWQIDTTNDMTKLMGKATEQLDKTTQQVDKWHDKSARQQNN